MDEIVHFVYLKALELKRQANAPFFFYHWKRQGLAQSSCGKSSWSSVSLKSLFFFFPLLSTQSSRSLLVSSRKASQEHYHSSRKTLSFDFFVRFFCQHFDVACSKDSALSSLQNFFFLCHAFEDYASSVCKQVSEQFFPLSCICRVRNG